MVLRLSLSQWVIWYFEEHSISNSMDFQASSLALVASLDLKQHVFDFVISKSSQANALILK